jgi:glycosyltransferase involved in cell wall biosynthesis
MKKISIITPCFNEEQTVKECHQRLSEAMKNSLPNYDYEHIFADNSSTDDTVQVLKQIALQDKHVKIIVNSRNVGPFRNMWNAMKSASGDAVIPLLPADLQDPPEVIPQFIARWELGDLIVYGIRRNRQESLLMRALRNIYYRIISRLADAVIPQNSGEFLLADRKVIMSVLDVDDTYPYIRGLIAQTGVRSSAIDYTWEKRKFGRSRNNFVDLLDQAINGLVSTSRMPARFALFLGFVLSFIGIVGAVATLISTLVNRQGVLPGIPTLIVAVFCFSGFQLLFLGLIGEYVLSIHSQVRRTPSMFELERINFEAEELTNGRLSSD